MESALSDNENKSVEPYKWDDSSTRLMLNFYKDALKFCGKTSHLRTKNQLWVHVVEELSKYGYYVAPKQAQNRLVTLERAFKKRQIDPRRSEIQEILEQKKNTNFGVDVTDLPDLSNSPEKELDDGSFANADYTASSNMSLNFGQTTDSNRWDPDSTKLFMNIYLKTVTNPGRMRTFKTKKKLWQYMADKVNSEGFEFTGRQVRNRISTLIRGYRRYIAKKRRGMRAFFMFESGVREMLKHKVTMPERSEIDSDGYDEEDDEDMSGGDGFEINFIDVEENNIDNIAIPAEGEATPIAELPFQSSDVSPELKLDSLHHNQKIDSDNAILNELRFLRKSNYEFHQKINKIEEEKLDLMRQNNILLKVLIEKLSHKS